MIVIDSIRGTSIPEGDAWLNDVQILAIKTCRHIESIVTLSKGIGTDLGHSKCALYVAVAKQLKDSRVKLAAFLPDDALVHIRSPYWPWHISLTTTIRSSFATNSWRTCS
jgi:hypothetical protein